MSQNIVLQTTPSQTLFPLNMPSIDALFPGFAPGDFAVICGSPSIQTLTSLLAVNAQLPRQLRRFKQQRGFCGRRQYLQALPNRQARPNPPAEPRAIPELFFRAQGKLRHPQKNLLLFLLEAAKREKREKTVTCVF